jgi:hypothetical protein
VSTAMPGLTLATLMASSSALISGKPQGTTRSSRALPDVKGRFTEQKVPPRHGKGPAYLFHSLAALGAN